MARRFAILVCLALMLSAPALADGGFTIDVDALDMGRLNSDAYVAANLSSSEPGLRVTKTVSASSEVACTVRLTITQMDTQTLIFDRDYGYVAGLFDSGVIYLPNGGGRTIPYLVTLYAGEYVYAMPYMQLQPRLSHNGACTYGVRLRDLDPSLGSDWLMGTMINLPALSARGSRTVDICASNSYVIGQATLEMNGSSLRVNLAFATGANVDVNQLSLYVITDCAAYANGHGAPSYGVGQWVDVSGCDTALIYLPMQLSYDPAGLPTFTYNLQDAALQEQLRLWQQATRSTHAPSQPDGGWQDDSGWDDGWNDGGWDNNTGWDDGWNSTSDGWM